MENKYIHTYIYIRRGGGKGKGGFLPGRADRNRKPSTSNLGRISARSRFAEREVSEYFLPVKLLIVSPTSRRLRMLSKGTRSAKSGDSGLILH
jgi:hypothetical protein